MPNYLEAKRQLLVAEFERRLNTEKSKLEVVGVADNYGLDVDSASVQFSLFELGVPKLSFNLTEEEFHKIIKDKKPKEIYYKEVNADDAGTWGSICIKPNEYIEIYLSHYIWGYSGIWDQICKPLGYRDEQRTTGFKNHSGKFVLE